MPRQHARLSLRLLGIVIPFGLCACADALTVADSPPTSRQLLHDYDKTLTKAEQEAAISDLQKATAKKQGEAGAEAATAAGTKSGENSN